MLLLQFICRVGRDFRSSAVAIFSSETARDRSTAGHSSKTADRLSSNRVLKSANDPTFKTNHTSEQVMDDSPDVSPDVTRSALISEHSPPILQFERKKQERQQEAKLGR